MLLLCVSAIYCIRLATPQDCPAVALASPSFFQNQKIQEALARIGKRVQDSLIPTSNPANFENDCVVGHNRYRTQLGLQLLTVNPALTKYAAYWAAQLASEDKMYHSKRNNGKYGENIFWARNRYTGNCKEALNWWYNKEHFIYRGEGIGKGEFEEYGHFTQMLWPDSQQVGCARVPYTAPNRSARTMVVCEYYPAGNILGKRLALTPETCDGVNLNGLTVSLK